MFHDESDILPLTRVGPRAVQRCSSYRDPAAVISALRASIE